MRSQFQVIHRIVRIAIEMANETIQESPIPVMLTVYELA
jgi:hypothetical protein